MKFSESWLREWVSPNVTTGELVEKLTMAGLEVDGIEPVAGRFSGVVIGEILSAEPHPDADKLQICQVRGSGDEFFKVVCGAKNARAGIKIPFAMIGAVLPGNFKIKKAKLRGVESFGMLCGQTELEAGDDDSGLWELSSDAPVGQDLREYLNLDDSIVELDLTPNRSDCLGIKGLSREVGVLYREDVAELNIEPIQASIDSLIPVKLEVPEACPRYYSRVVEGVDVSAPSPAWLTQRLIRSGIRPIDVIVDVTNYILLELGQPMHAFDRECINSSLFVRWAEPGERIKLLNDQELELSRDTLVIADEEKLLAVAGVMGGASSAVSSSTKSIVLEAAFFLPEKIAGKARNYGLHTDSSHRFERGVDYGYTSFAMERATALILDIAGGSAGPLICVEDQGHIPAAKEVVLDKSKISKCLGFAIPDKDVVDILTRLGLVVLSESSEIWCFAIPSYRFDISIAEDLLEELARIYGYNNLPTTTNMLPQVLPTKSEAQIDLNRANQLLLSREYQEVISYSFIEPELHRAFFGDDEALELLNPISADLSVMRISLVPSLLACLKSNVKRQHSRIRIFERGLRFVKSGDSLDQKAGIAGLVYGARTEQNWFADKDLVDFYDIKGDLEALLSLGSQAFDLLPATDISYMHPGQTANIYLAEEKVGYVGALHPELLKNQGVKKTVYVFELDEDAVSQSSVPLFTGISRYPTLERDLAFVVDKSRSAAEMKVVIRNAAGENLKQLKVFDIYSGEGIDSQRKSIAFNLTFQHSSRTLNEDEVNAAVQAVIENLEGELDAALR